jgi:hypothetical protein
LAEKITHTEFFELDFDLINAKIEELEIIFIKKEIRRNLHFIKWLNDFKEIYSKKQTTLRLYIAFALIYSIGLIFTSKFILGKNPSLFEKEKSILKLKDLEARIKTKFNGMNIVDFDYFNPVIEFSDEQNLKVFNNLIHKISNSLFKSSVKPYYMFDLLSQKLISSITRHKAGEYYTPPFLVAKMIKESYKFGDYVLDPCCGSGNFLIGLINFIKSQNKTKGEKIEAIERIYGFDVNPISIFMSKIHIIFLLKEQIPKIQVNLFVFNFLFQDREKFHEKFDLIIGNPPWYTYRDVDSLDYQEKLKNLAEKLEIKPRPKNLLNLEISTLFFFRANEFYMKNRAKIFFVITKGVITGSHASRFRNFNGFSNLKIWIFDRKIEKIFNIEFICLYGQKSNIPKNTVKIEIPASYYSIINESIEVEYFNENDLKLDKIEVLKPFSIEESSGKTYVHKLISNNEFQNLLPIKESYYKKLFHKGADLNPRNLIFVKYKQINEVLFKINPENRIFKRAKLPWDKREFKDEIIEKKYVFKVLKSTELVKFHVYDSYDVFLPLIKEDLSFKYHRLDKNAKRFYDKINRIYLQNKKETTPNKSLIDNLDRWAKLCNQRQLSHIKVVYNNSGAVLNSAVIKGDYLITGDLSFYATKNIDEAYYLSAILNSNILTQQIKIMKSSRHIFKLPFEISINKFEAKNQIHNQLAILAKRGEEIVKKEIINDFKKKNNKVSRNKIQSIINERLAPIFKEIDEFLIHEFKEEKN